MWRLTALNMRKDGVTPEQHLAGWLDDLGPAIQAAASGRLRRLVVNLPPRHLSPEIAAIFSTRFDGLAELWFDSRRDAVAALNALSRDETILARADRIIDARRGVVWLAEAKFWKPELGQTSIKFLAGGEVAEGLTVEEAQKYYAEIHPVVAQTLPDLWALLTRYTQFHGREIPELRMGDWLGVPRFVPLCSDMGFAEQSSFMKTYTDERYHAIIRPDEEKFSRPGEMLAFISGEERDLLGNSLNFAPPARAVDYGRSALA